MAFKFSYTLTQNALEQTLAAYPAAALVTPDGELLVSYYQSLADIGTLPVAALTCHQYFQIKPDDVVIINDPYSGGGVLSSINLVTGLSLEGSGRSSEALLVVRLQFKPRLFMADSVDSEGVRIPPTPLVSQGSLNEEILQAICAHPLAPATLKDNLYRALAQLQETKLELSRVCALTGFSLNKKTTKDWIYHTQTRFQKILGDLAVGSARAEVQMGPKSKLCLQMEIREQKVSFNFTGTGAPEKFAMSDAATLGACIGALAATLNTDVPVNAGTMRAIDVIAPLGSIVHAKYPSPVYMGLTDGTAIVAGLVVKLLGQIDKKLQTAQSGVSQCAVEFDFGSGLYFFDDMEPGMPGTRVRRGADGLDPWRRTHLQRSVEAIERIFPLQVRLAAIRSQSGGSGLMGGGDGQTKVYELLKPARFRWFYSRILKPEGVHGGRSAIGPEISVQRKDAEKEELAENGELNLAAGDQVIINSAGGGGYGEAAPAT